jgi:cysteinyl-tRNA synthetase
MDDRNGFKGLRLYNTLTGGKEDFVPFDPRNVRMYVCGPTVYDYAHIGNARPVIVFDVLFRLLRHLYGAEHVTYVRNITDVDDKIILRAAEDGVSIEVLTEGTLAQFQADIKALGCLTPTHEPRATKYIAPMKSMIETLVAHQNAYVEADHVLFNVASFPDYGRLSKRTLDEMIAGARVEVAPYKRNPMDFVLWKPSDQRKSNVLLPKWKSPCDIEMPGRPGWHIECSAMSGELLGETFDIHGGGIDLVFPHHENEIAQSRCAHHTKEMARYWLHNGFLQVEGRKMAKSEGNFVTIRELREEWQGYGWPGDALRFAMLRTHYRQPIDWTAEGLEQSHKILWEWYGAVEDAGQADHLPTTFLNLLCDDLNTAGAITELHRLRGAGNFGALRSALSFLGFSCERSMLGRTAKLSGQANILFRARARAMVIPREEKEKIANLVNARSAARAAKNFAEADRIRDQLDAMGIQLKDSKDPATGEFVTTWEVKR